MNRRLERRGRRLVRSDVGRLYLGAGDVAGEIYRDTVDKAPNLITAQRILTGLIGGRCTSSFTLWLGVNSVREPREYN